MYVYCNTLQHTATHCNTLQHTATHCNTGGSIGEQSSAAFFFAARQRPVIFPTKRQVRGSQDLKSQPATSIELYENFSKVSSI